MEIEGANGSVDALNMRPHSGMSGVAVYFFKIRTHYMHVLCVVTATIE